MAKQGISERWYGDAEHDPIHEAAAEWFARLQDAELALEDTLAWQHWMAADARHAEAFRRIEDVWRQFGPIEDRDPDVSAGTDLSSYDGSIPISDWLARAQASGRESTRSSSTRVFRFAIAASVAVAAIGAVLVLAMNTGLLLSSITAEVVRTSVGENRVMKLPDGSQLTLGGDTRVKFDFGPTTRRITLDRGEAYFAVAKDASRPFTVRAGEATVTAVGTGFNVRRSMDRVVVAVVEGRVTVEPTESLLPIAWLRESSSKREPMHLDAGQQAAVEKSGIKPATLLTDPAAATAWQTGHLAFEREPLRYVVENVNRYAAKRIVIEDASIGELMITGTVANNNVGGWIRSLESAFALEAVEEPDRIVLTHVPVVVSR